MDTTNTGFTVLGDVHQWVERRKQIMPRLTKEERMAFDLVLTAIGNAYCVLDQHINHEIPFPGINADMPAPVKTVALTRPQIMKIYAATMMDPESKDLIHIYERPDKVVAIVENHSTHTTDEVFEEPKDI